jgi:hypothetical protein
MVLCRCVSRALIIYFFNVFWDVFDCGSCRLKEEVSIML